MKRGYTKEWFLNRCRKVQELCPKATISTDIIVGFPDESEDDFADTLDVVEQVRFQQIFSFKYSPRPHTLATTFSNQIPNEIASRRLMQLQRRQSEIVNEIMKAQMGKIHTVYFDELKAGGKVSGRSDDGKLFLIDGSEELLGEIKNVKVTETSRGALGGTII